MNPVAILITALIGWALWPSVTPRRRSSKGTFTKSKPRSGQKKAGKTHSTGGHRFRMHNGKKQYVDGRGKPYTPKNAPSWLRKMWLDKARRTRKGA